MFVSNKDLATVCGGLAGGMIGYSLGGSPEVVCVAAVIGAIVARSINRSIVEKDFEYFHLDNVEKFKKLGDVDNVSMFAHRHFVLSKQKLCLYLRNMDQEEYDYMKNEHEIATNATSLKEPVLKGLKVFAGGTGVVSIPLLVIQPAFLLVWLGLSVAGSSVIGASVGMNDRFVKVEQGEKDLERDRLARLDDKIIRLAARIESLVDCPKEKHQLQLARGYFFRTLQAHTTNKGIVKNIHKQG